MSDTIKFLLEEEDIPKSWYNIVSDLPVPPPPVLHPGTGQPVGPDDLAPLFSMAAIMQEVSGERTIDIPDPVRDIYRQWRPSPLFRARRLEKALDTPARIYYKYEGVSPAGSHKPPFTARKKASSASPPRPVPGSGAHRWPWPGLSSALRSKCSWCG